jgi:hypothetical protein
VPGGGGGGGRTEGDVDAGAAGHLDLGGREGGREGLEMVDHMNGIARKWMNVHETDDPSLPPLPPSLHPSLPSLPVPHRYQKQARSK